LAVAAALPKAQVGYRKSAVVVGEDNPAVDAAMAFDCLLEFRSPQMKGMEMSSQIVRIACILRNLRRKIVMSLGQLVDVVVTSKITTDTEFQSAWYLTVSEFHRLFFIAGAQGISRAQAAKLYRLLDANQSGRLHLTEFQQGIEVLTAECERRSLLRAEEILEEIPGKLGQERDEEDEQESSVDIEENDFLDVEEKKDSEDEDKKEAIPRSPEIQEHDGRISE
jgi:hypothetical protein